MQVCTPPSVWEWTPSSFIHSLHIDTLQNLLVSPPPPLPAGSHGNRNSTPATPKLGSTSPLRFRKRRNSSPSSSPPRHERSKSGTISLTQRPSSSQSSQSNLSSSVISSSSRVVEHLTPVGSTSQIRQEPASAIPTTTLVIDRFIVEPWLMYWNKRSPLAEQEYCDMVRPVLERECGIFDSYVFGFVHIGETKSTAFPAVVVIGSGMDETIARNIKAKLHELQTTHVCDFAFYDGQASKKCELGDTGSTQNVTGNVARDIEIGGSIGPVGVPLSCSLGPHFRLENDDSSYCVTVQHGVSETPLSSTTQRIRIQQPSSPDLYAQYSALNQTIQSIEDGAYAHIPQSRNIVANARADLEKLNTDEKDGKFIIGNVIAQKFGTFPEGASEDWAIIKLQDSSHVINRIPTARIIKCPLAIPLDSSHNYYITQADNLYVNDKVYKFGRTTSVTEGEISCVRCDVKLPGAQSATNEYTVISNNIYNRFSWLGDSGSPVMGNLGTLKGIIVGGTEGAPILLEGYSHLGPVVLSYITPWTYIKSSIERTLNCNVILDVVPKDRLSRNGNDVLP